MRTLTILAIILSVAVPALAGPPSPPPISGLNPPDLSPGKSILIFEKDGTATTGSYDRDGYRIFRENGDIEIGRFREGGGLTINRYGGDESGHDD